MQIVVVSSIEKGIEKVKEELYRLVDKKTVLFLSGGSTPKSLYETFAKEEVLHPAAVAMVDERYGKNMHENSNERMIKETGLTKYFERKLIPFHGILEKNASLEKTAKDYDETVRSMFFHFPKSVGILGIGADGHTAGIAPNRKKEFINPLFAGSQKHVFVDAFSDPTGPFGDRVTLTFAGLSLLDFVVVMVFGKEKKKALKKVFTSGRLEDVPARFYTSRDMAKKTIVITDQRV